MRFAHVSFNPSRVTRSSRVRSIGVMHRYTTVSAKLTPQLKFLLENTNEISYTITPYSAHVESEEEYIKTLLRNNCFTLNNTEAVVNHMFNTARYAPPTDGNCWSIIEKYAHHNHLNQENCVRLPLYTSTPGSSSANSSSDDDDDDVTQSSSSSSEHARASTPTLFFNSSAFQAMSSTASITAECSAAALANSSSSRHQVMYPLLPNADTERAPITRSKSPPARRKLSYSSQPDAAANCARKQSPTPLKRDPSDTPYLACKLLNWSNN